MPKSQFDVAWRDQNAWASKAVLRRSKANERANRDKITPREVVGRKFHDVPKVLPQDYESYALNFFFDSYILLPSDPSCRRGVLDCLYPIWTRMSPLSPLKPAISAVALALLEAWSQSNPNRPQSLSRSYYVEAVAAVRRRLQSAQATDDDVLVATLMLNMYDGITSFCGARPQESLHMRGSMALIEDRRRQSLNSETSQRILLGARGQYIGRALRSKEPVPRDILNWTTASASSIPNTPANDLEEIQFEVANLQASASSLASDPTTSSNSSAMNILAEASDLDQRLMDWMSTIPDDWVPTYVWGSECIPESAREAGMYQSHCTIHKSISVANVLNGYCCSRIKVQLVILACLDHINDLSLDITRWMAHETIQDLADMICATVPYFLGNRVRYLRIDDKSVQYPRAGSKATPVEHYAYAAAYAGIFLTQQLSELLIPGLPLRDGQRQWVLSQMGRIKRVYLASPHPAS